jgi:hypothetical protein
MLSQELTLFDIPETKLQTKSCTTTVKRPEISHKQYASLDNALSAIFPSTEQDNIIIKTRRHLGEVGKEMSDAEIKNLANEFQFLIDSWLDMFEKETFQGKTLKEIMGGK